MRRRSFLAAPMLAGMAPAVRAATDDDTFLAMIEGRSSAFSPEGLRLRALNLLRSAVGANRYARVRERLLDLWPTRGE